MTNQEIKEQEARGVSVITWRSPPLESQLSDHTLWLGKNENCLLFRKINGNYQKREKCSVTTMKLFAWL